MPDAKGIPLAEVQFKNPVNFDGMKSAVLERQTKTLEYSVSDRMIRAVSKDIRTPDREVLIPIENVSFLRVRTGERKPDVAPAVKPEPPKPHKDDTIKLTQDDVAKAMKR